MSRPFLLLSIRAEDEAADDEYAAMRRFTGLDERGLRRIRLTHSPLGRLDLDEWSGILLGGGPYNVSDPPAQKSAGQRRTEEELLALVDDVVAADFPFLGCCYGIGTVGTHLGAVLDHTHAEPVGATTVTLTDAGRTDPLLGALPATFDAFVGHKEAIRHLPEPGVLLATSPGCPVQAFRVGEHVYATQFHPELDVAGLCTRIDVYRDHGYFVPDRADSLKEEVRRRDVVHPPTILRRFVDRYQRP